MIQYCRRRTRHKLAESVVVLSAEALAPNDLGEKADSESKSQQPYLKDSLLTTTWRTHKSARPANCLFSSLTNVCLNVAPTATLLQSTCTQISISLLDVILTCETPTQSL